ncbi:MAG: RNA methyltransferase [Algoriphagus sp.]|uniref:TrmH family RNA methyltransferase n=1 Tax=Algoriphagus sp. TaxID=1872435 RepID=UPI00260636AE|nr:RNA methyltransferase [Algoriphagus sp.]MDG1279278.1 RNA methyltransferase [Algoriphagus sp.]
MLSKNTVKFIKSLHQKKFRNQEQRFFVEGEKSVLEVLNSTFEVELLLATEHFISVNRALISKTNTELIPVTQKQLEGLGQYQSNDSALAVVKLKSNQEFDYPAGKLVIGLDDVRDPGNLGTIIRIADWYGIKHLVFSPQTADFYNPKVIQASMGSFTRVDFFYTDLKSIFEKWNVPIYGAFLNGQNIHRMHQPNPGIILMGNESQGISDELEKLVTQKVTIPGFGAAESLNVAIATAIICDNFKRLLP